MSNKNFEFPGIELTQDFVATSTGVDTTLNCICIGENFLVHRGESEDDKITKKADGTAFVYDGVANVDAAYPGHKANNTVVTTTVKVIIRNPKTAAGIQTGKEMQVPADKVTATAEKVTISSGIQYESSAVIGGDFYMIYNERNAAYNSTVGSLASASQVEAVLGLPCKDNPLAAAVYAALSASNGAVVSFTAVTADTAAAYNEALARIEHDHFYSVVPATGTTEVHNAVLTNCKTLSSDSEAHAFRVCWLGLDTPTPTGTPTKDELIDSIIEAKTIADVRAQVVWADGLRLNGTEDVGNYAGAAAAAGMRSGEEPHRPLSTLTYSAITVANTNNFTRAQLKRLGEAGIWIIGKNSKNMACNMHQITSIAAGSPNLDEESMIAAVDEIAYALCGVGESYVGCSNISDMLLALLSTDITIIMDARCNNVKSVYAGPQLVSWSLVSLAQDTVHKDHVNAVIECTPPAPFNKFKMTLRVI